MLGGRQDATLLLTDFPIALLQPVLRAMPGLQHAQPAVGLTGRASPTTAWQSNSREGVLGHRGHAAAQGPHPGVSSAQLLSVDDLHAEVAQASLYIW